MVVHEAEPSSLSSFDEDVSELMVLQGQVEPDLMTKLFMDQFEVFFVIRCHICIEVLLFYFA
jgi:hypothetical protein